MSPPPRPSNPLLAYRGVVLVDPALLPALVPDGWTDAGSVHGLRLVQAGGKERATRPFLLVPTLQPGAAVRAVGGEGAAAVFRVGACWSPTRALEPGQVLVVDHARTPAGVVEASKPLATKLVARCANHRLEAKRGPLASGGLQAELHAGDLGEDENTAEFLRAAEEMGVPAAAALVCAGVDGQGADAPGAVLEAFDRLFGVLQEMLGSDRRPEQG